MTTLEEHKRFVEKIHLAVLKNMIAQIEAAHFRTVTDSGATEQALFIWNCVRGRAGLPPLTMKCLPAHDGTAYVMPPDSKLLSNLNN